MTNEPQEISEPTKTCEECERTLPKDDMIERYSGWYCPVCDDQLGRDLAIDAKIDESRGK